MDRHSGFVTAQDALDYIFGGNATVTLTSAKSGDHYTYKVRQKDNEDGTKTPFFVSVLNGPDNYANYKYIGMVNAETRDRIDAGRKGDRAAPAFLAFDWALAHLTTRKAIPDTLTIQHEGKCCRCGRKLTHPESIASGIGPDCATRGA